LTLFQIKAARDVAGGFQDQSIEKPVSLGFYLPSNTYPVPRTLMIHSLPPLNCANLRRKRLTKGRMISGASQSVVWYPWTNMTNSR
jgi:hypothetical protein